jgi:predicted nucleic acid-binding protein
LDLKRFVLDSYAIMAYLERTEGVEQVKELFREANAGRCQLFMSIVNVGEVLYITEREYDIPAAQTALAKIDELPIKIIDAGRTHTVAASHIKAGGRISLADCYAASLAAMEHAVVVTGDLEFKRLENANIVPVMWLNDD